jgi:hypothetical protein
VDFKNNVHGTLRLGLALYNGHPHRSSFRIVFFLKYRMDKVQKPTDSEHIVNLCNLNTYVKFISQIGNLTSIEANEIFSRYSHIPLRRFTFVLRKGRGQFVYYYKNVLYVLHFPFHYYRSFNLSFISHEHQWLWLPCARVMVHLTSDPITRSKSRSNFLHQMFRILRILYYLNLFNNSEV